MKEYKQFNLKEREQIYLLKQEGKGVRQIAKILKRSPSSVSRELNRNNNKRLGYLPDAAHTMARKRKAKHGTKLLRHPEVKELIIEQLKDGWSPEVIAGRGKLEEHPIWLSHESIYQFIYSREGMECGLYRLLLRAKPKRGKLYGRRPQKSKIPDRVSIHDRPENIATREEFGHLEGDLTFFTDNQSINLGVMVERKTRLTLLIKNDSKHASVVMKGIFNKLAVLPSFARKSITFDNGLEFVNHTLLKQFMGIDTYFCDKHSPWQKGQVEQTNSMIHRYLPKKSIIKETTYEQIKCIENKLNCRPRKCLGFKTPTEVFAEQLKQCVALQT